jgi:hypothetical protein
MAESPFVYHRVQRVERRVRLHDHQRLAYKKRAKIIAGMKLQFATPAAMDLSDLAKLRTLLCYGKHRMAYEHFPAGRFPTGCFVCSDGREVLHDRGRRPVFEIGVDDRERGSNPDEWVEDVESEEQYFHGTLPKYQQYVAMKTLKFVIGIRWGLPLQQRRIEQRTQRLFGQYGGRWLTPKED